MITFTSHSFIIEVETCTSPVENWLSLQKSLHNLIRNVDNNNIQDDLYATIDFLSELLPDWENARIMAPEK
jgi:hypothetical protein